ncbi:hypothetical protein ACMC56_11475 [Campylobacterota bacterium DY0563]
MELKDIVQVILNKNSSYGDLFDASRNLGNFFAKFSFISTKDNHNESYDSTHTTLSSGVAISPLDAAICINEYMRTTKYIRGIYDALNDLLEKFKDEKIHVLYAGTGPYATLVSPLLHLFDSKRLEVTFLDIHQSSLDSVKSILDIQKLSIFVKDYKCVDATTYKSKSKVHMIITETMRASFEGEPQVNITLNLLPQLCKDGVFIPESVNIYLESALKKLVQKDNSIKNLKESYFLEYIIKLDSKKKWNRENLILIPKLKIKDDIKDGYELFLCTQIKVYKNHILNENESSLNIPLPILINQRVVKGDIFEFSYEFENRPEILYEHKKTNLSFVENDKNFYPMGISYRYKESTIIWQEILSNRFLKPFFSDETRGSKKKYLSWKALKEIIFSSKCLEPKGFIFHTSRCGSTLLSNALSSLERNIVIKESPFIHDILTSNYKEKISKNELKQRFKDAVKVLGRKRFDFEENFYIKFNCWEIANIDFIRKLYPNVPILILYRKPKEILSSHKKITGIQMVPQLLKGKLFDSITNDIPFDKYPLNVLEIIFEYCQLQKDKSSVMFVNYQDIKNLFFSKIAPFFDLNLDDNEIELIKSGFEFYSKNQTEKFDQSKDEKMDNIFISDKLKNSFAFLEKKKVCCENE